MVSQMYRWLLLRIFQNTQYVIGKNAKRKTRLLNSIRQGQLPLPSVALQIKNGASVPRPIEAVRCEFLSALLWLRDSPTMQAILKGCGQGHCYGETDLMPFHHR